MSSTAVSVVRNASSDSLRLPSIEGAQTLLFDADDTLWENNVLFERAIAQFVEMVAHPTMHVSEVREAFNQLEHARVQVHGYGTKSFRASMLACYELLRDCPCGDRERARIAGFAGQIANAPIELLNDVKETLEALAAKHRLVLMTKGDPEEQVGKLERSGLAALFDHTEVVREKHRQAYVDLRSHHRLDAATTWMIGNSPKSDINPALLSGLHAILIPHPNTWVLENETLSAAPLGQHLLVLQHFAALKVVFLS